MLTRYPQVVETASRGANEQVWRSERERKHMMGAGEMSVSRAYPRRGSEEERVKMKAQCCTQAASESRISSKLDASRIMGEELGVVTYYRQRFE